MRISLLGAIRIDHSSGAVTSFRSSRVPALLGYLLAHPGLTPRDQIADALWPNEDREHARHNLRQTWLYLKQALEPHADAVLSSTRSHLGLDGEKAESDVGELIASEQPAEFDRKIEISRKAVAHYGGEFLAGIDLPWIQDVRSRLASLYFRALIFLADATLADDPGESLKYAEKAVNEEPLQDGARARKIRALMKLGEKAAAQLEYEEFEKLLDEELGMTPADIVLEALDGGTPKTEPPARLNEGRTSNDVQFALQSLQTSDRPQHAVDLAIALTPHWINVGTPTLGLVSLEQALEKAGRTLAPEKLRRAELSRAQLALARGDMNTASRLVEGLLERKGQLDKSLQSQVLLLQCHVAIANAAGKRSSALAEEAFELSAQTVDKSLQLDALLSLSITAISEGTSRQGLEYANRALEIGTELGEMTGIASALVRKAFALETLNRPAESERVARRAWKLLASMDSSRATSLRIDLARLLEDLGRLSEAESAYRQCAEECRRLDSKFREMVVLTYLGDMLQARGLAAEAASIHREVLDQRRKLEQQPGIATSLRGLGKALADLGKFDDAREALAESAHVHLNIEHQPGYASVVAEMAKMEARTGNIQLALRLANRASQLLRALTQAEKKRIGRSGFTLLAEMETFIQANTATG